MVEITSGGSISVCEIILNLVIFFYIIFCLLFKFTLLNTPHTIQRRAPAHAHSHTQFLEEPYFIINTVPNKCVDLNKLLYCTPVMGAFYSVTHLFRQ